MSVQAHSSDVETLHRMGYAQELVRRMSGFSNFAVSFTIISILAGCLTLYYFGMSNGGPAVITIGWPVVGVMVILVGLAVTAAVVALARRPRRRAGGPARERPGGA